MELVTLLVGVMTWNVPLVGLSWEYMLASNGEREKERERTKLKGRDGVNHGSFELES